MLTAWYFKRCLIETRPRATVLDRDSTETEQMVIVVDRISIDFNPSATFILPVSKKVLTTKDGPQTCRVGDSTRSRNSKQHVGCYMRAGTLWCVVWCDLHHWFPHPLSLKLSSCERNISGPPEKNYLTHFHVFMAP
jgi:hypothetical protein